MNDEMDPLDALLRDQFGGPVPDDGFSKRVMDRLPARRRRSTWPLVAGAMLGVVTCWISLWFVPIPFIGWGDWLAGNITGSATTLFIAMMGIALLALAWTIAEASDEFEPSSRRIA